MQKVKDLKELGEWIEKMYGERCKDYSIGCIACQAWRIYDDLEHLLTFGEE